MDHGLFGVRFLFSGIKTEPLLQQIYLLLQRPLSRRSERLILIETEESLGDLISRDGNLSSAFSRKVHALS